ncbi:MAG: nicotinate-nucleotide adenylyltransferase [Rhodospirillales bacterium]|nr:MAG: nicotinate-nucleotide adenylyltransferase [Rhodospirillales bacterium]
MSTAISDTSGMICRCRRRIGLLGGSFNPAHAGHLHISEVALRRLGLDEVWWLVSPQNPLKSEAGMAPLPDRLAAAQRRAEGRRIRVTGIEMHLGTRYTVDTVAALRRRWPRARFVWLIGADNLVELPRWHRWPELFRRVPIAVFARRPYSLRALSGVAAQRFVRSRLREMAAGVLAGRKPPAWVFLHCRAHPASATAIRGGRRALSKGK